MAAVSHLKFSKFGVSVMWTILCFSVRNFTEIGQSAVYDPNDFKMAAVRHLESKQVYRRRYESAACQSPNCIKKTKKNKIWRKTIFSTGMADEIITPGNVARS